MVYTRRDLVLDNLPRLRLGNIIKNQASLGLNHYIVENLSPHIDSHKIDTGDTRSFIIFENSKYMNTKRKPLIRPTNNFINKKSRSLNSFSKKLKQHLLNITVV